MPRHDDGPTRLYVGRLSSRARSRDLEALFSRYGRVRDVAIKHDFAFVEFSDPRDADDARHYLNGKEFEGHRIIVEFARRSSRGSNNRKDSRGPPPGTGRCYNCGNEGHWARDCKAGDWKDKCYRCGQRGHIERNCRNSPRSSRYDRSVSRSRSRSVDRDSRRSRSRSLRVSRSRSRSVDRDNRRSRSRSLRVSRSRSRSVDRNNRRSRSRSLSRRHHRSTKYSKSPVRSSVYEVKERSMSPAEERKEPLSPRDNIDEHRSRSISRSKSPSPVANGRRKQSLSPAPEERGEESPNGVLQNE